MMIGNLDFDDLDGVALQLLQEFLRIYPDIKITNETRRTVGEWLYKAQGWSTAEIAMPMNWCIVNNIITQKG